MSLDGRHVFETALGLCAVSWRGGQLAALSLCIDASEDPCAVPPAPVGQAIDAVRRYLDGAPEALSGHPVDPGVGSPFERRVHAVLRSIPRGMTVTYGELARRAGCPGAARAVGTAMARNPLPLFVPCHRVVPASGAIGAYSAGRGGETKAWLLALEGVRDLPSSRGARMLVPSPSP